MTGKVVQQALQPLAQLACRSPDRRTLLPFGLVPGLLLVALLSGGRADAAEEQAAVPEDLTGLSLESLMNIQVTTVSKHAEKLSEVAAAAYVLSGEEIRRSGVRSLPEALRLIPGLTVAQIDAHTWAVTARGFNGTVADKLEVLMDGRSLYTPFFSGVFWDEKNTFLADIDRIEVIRGPGGTLWGANAVNGVINIVTKSAADTQGTLVEAGGGGEIDHFAGIRHGGKLGDSGHYRAYVQTHSYGENERVSGVGADDDWEQTQAGFRTDWSRGEQDRFTVQGDVYDGSIDTAAETQMEGHNLIGRWTRILSDSSDLSLQFFYDHYKRDVPSATAGYVEERDTYDIDFQHRFQWRPKHEILWGGGYRRSSDDIATTGILAFVPDSRTVETVNLFVQDQIDVTDKFKVTVGSKFEDNDFTGFEVQPSIRLAYLLDEKRTVWGAVSRAVRTPNRLDHGLSAPPFLVNSTEFESEVVIAYELGYRTQLRDNLLLDTALYYNQYDKLRGIRNVPPPSIISNEGEGDGYGIEITALWVVNDDWRIHAGYNFQHLDIDPKSGSSDTSIENADRNDPHHQFLLRSSWDLASNWTLDGTLRHVSGLPDQHPTGSGDNVDSYSDLDLRLAWQYSKALEFALVGSNLLHASHVEFGTNDPVEMERSIMGTMTWRFE
jgi:iron complex outermembrane receptor protein